MACGVVNIILFLVFLKGDLMENFVGCFVDEIKPGRPKLINVYMHDHVRKNHSIRFKSQIYVI